MKIKNIKKSLKYISIISGSIILLSVIVYLLLQNPSVQTYIVNRITKHLSEDIKSTISIKKIEYKFFNKLIINELLIKDVNSDTLIYSEKVIAEIKRADNKKKIFRLGRVTVIKPVVALITDSTNCLNLDMFLEKLKNPSDSLKKGTTRFYIEQIDVNNGNFSLVNHPVKRVKAGINFSNLHLLGINGIIEDLKIENDTTKFNIYNLGFTESSGFRVRRMKSSMVLAKRTIKFKNTDILTDSSNISMAELSMLGDSLLAFRDFTNNANLDIIFKESLISSYDLSYFIPDIQHLSESLSLSGKVYGTISELRGRHINIKYRNRTILNCDFNLSGLPDLDNTFLYVGVNKFITNANDIDKINIKGKALLNVPQAIYKLGDISFDGSFTGFTTDFVTYGRIRTSEGNIYTDVSLRPVEGKKYSINGVIEGDNINLGFITGNKDKLGKLTLHTNIDGYAYSLNRFALNITGTIDSLIANRYLYKDISLKGLITEKTWDGNIEIMDDNLEMSFMGLLNLKEKLPVFNFTLDIAKADLFKLNIDKPDTSSSLSFLLTSNFKGNSIDNLDGEIKILNSRFIKYNEELELNDFTIRTYTENNKPVLSLSTDFVDADIKGHYNFSELGDLMRSTLAKLMPTKFALQNSEEKHNENNFDFLISFKNTDRLNSFLRTGISLSDKSRIQGTILSDSIISITGNAGYFNFRNNLFKDLSFDISVADSAINAEVNSSSLALLNQYEQEELYIVVNTRPDSFIVNYKWDNKDKILNKGTLAAHGLLFKDDTISGNNVLKVYIDSSVVYAKNNPWKVNSSSIIIDSNSINIDKFYIESYNNYYLVDGSVSSDPLDTLFLKFNGIDIAPLNYLLNKNGTDDSENNIINFKGRAKGKIQISNIYKNMLIESNITINEFSLLGDELGDLSVRSALNSNNKIISINAGNIINDKNTLNITGYYDPSAKYLNLNGKADGLSINLLNPLLRSFASGINGSASGAINLSGHPGNLVLNGALMVNNASLQIDYLKTIFSFNDTVRFNKNGIIFNNINVSDESGNLAALNGIVKHKSFKDFGADLSINIQEPNECLVLNTKPKDNDVFYGTAYMSGFTTIKSGTNIPLSFDISAKTGENTTVFIPLTSGTSVSEDSFITFVDESYKENRDSVTNDISIASVTVNNSGMDLKFDLTVTPEAEVQIIFDPQTGEIMKGRGSGILNISLNRSGDFNITGDYNIEEGDYTFILGNLVNKTFAVENGGRIIFNGDIDNAEIDVKAIYKLRTSLNNILSNIAPDEVTNERIPVECQLELTGKLFNPVVGFNIYLPTADEKTRSYVRNIISTEDKLTRQFLYLLITNSFYPDPSFVSSSSTASSSAINATKVTTIEMLSNQLSNWVSQISNDWDVNIGYRPGTKDLNSDEVQVGVSTQILNNKVVIHSNVDYHTNNESAGNTDKITGDFDFEFGEDKIKFKVFNRFNDPYTGKLAPYTQGFGILFRKDFDKFSDLVGRKNKREEKKRRKK